MLLVVAEAALKAARPFLRYGPRQFFPLPFVFAGPSLPLEVGTDAVSGGEPPVPVGGIDAIAPDDLDLGPGQADDAAHGAYAVIKKGMLLSVHFLGRRPSHVLVHGEGKSVRFLHTVPFQGELFGQQEQRPCQGPGASSWSSFSSCCRKYISFSISATCCGAWASCSPCIPS